MDSMNNPISRRSLLATSALAVTALTLPPGVKAKPASYTASKTGSASQFYKLLPNLYAVAGANLSHRYDGNAYLLTYANGAALIDCGSELGHSALMANVKAVGVAPESITHVFATHCHWDHISGAAKLRQAVPQSKLCIHEGDAEAVRSADRDLTATFLYGEQLKFPALAPAVVLAGGETFSFGKSRVEVVHTPGHTPGSVCYAVTVDGKRILLAGDTLWGGCHHRIRSDLQAWEKSLDKLMAQEFDYLSWGHYEPWLFDDTKTRLAEARAQFGVYLNPWFKPFYKTFKY